MVKKKEKKINIKTRKGKIKPPERVTTPAVWNPWDLMDRMDRWFWEDPWVPIWRRRWSGLTPAEKLADQWFDTDKKITAIDMIDTGKEYKIKAEMPGVNKKDVEVNITTNNISICGEIKIETDEKDKGWVRRERSYSTICRTMTFPEEVNPDKADATLNNGILEILVKKKTPTTGTGRNISVK
jgi:HSP20 family molecular chaperone IbpA